MESKIWILLVLALPILLFVTDAFVVSPAIYEKEGALHDFFIKYLVSPAEKIGLSMEDITYFLPKYVWDFYIIIFSALLILITDIKFSDFGFDFGGLKKDIIIGVLFFIVDIILVFGVIYVSSYIPSYVKDFSLGGSSSSEKHDISRDSTGLVPVESAKPVLGFKFLILNFILYFFFVGPAEEVFRLFTFLKLEKASNGFVAFVLSAFMFGAMHIFGSGFQCINAFVGGLAYNALWLLRGRRIMSPIVAHGFYDFMLTVLPFIF